MQEKFCNSACVERFLKAKGDSVKKTAKVLRACLSWRNTVGTGNSTTDYYKPNPLVSSRPHFFLNEYWLVFLFFWFGMESCSFHTLNLGVKLLYQNPQLPLIIKPTSFQFFFSINKKKCNLFFFFINYLF